MKRFDCFYYTIEHYPGVGKPVVVIYNSVQVVIIGKLCHGTGSRLPYDQHKTTCIVTSTDYGDVRSPPKSNGPQGSLHLIPYLEYQISQKHDHA